MTGHTAEINQMLRTITITPVSPDRPDVLALITELDAYYQRVYQPEHIHVLDLAGLLQPEVYFLAAEVDGTAVGCGGFCRCDGYVEIKRMYVAPTYRGQGIATRMLTALEELIRREGFRVILLESGDQQPEAIRLYARMGYAPIQPFVHYADDPHALFYEKRLG